MCIYIYIYLRNLYVQNFVIVSLSFLENLTQFSLFISAAPLETRNRTYRDAGKGMTLRSLNVSADKTR